MARLTERQAKFVETFAATGSKQIAAREAGYAHPDVKGYAVAESPSVYAAIVREQNRILFSEILPDAVSALGEIVRDKHAPTGARVNAIKLVLERTVGAADGQAKEAHEMTADELAEAINKLEALAAEKAREISGEVVEPGVFD